jgi:16S rRNA (cytidine1402-2'-O)-methyltransferase
MGQAMTGTLYVVATPIGNLEDLTRRAERILREADLIAAEDTRHTRHLLSSLGLRKTLLSHHEHNEAQSAAAILAELKAGKNVALVSDAGTPGLSDPGARLVRLAQEAGITVVPVPGPSALAAALSAAGIPGEEFSFLGFLPAKKSARRKKLLALKNRPERLVLFEAPHRLAESLLDLAEVLGDREATLLRELTKLHEEVRRSSLRALYEEAKARSLKGEITLVVAGAPATADQDRAGLEEELRDRLSAGGISLKQLAEEVAERRGLSRNEVYRLALRLRQGESLA